MKRFSFLTKFWFWKKFIITILVLALFLITFKRMSYVLRDKSLDNQQDNFAALERDSVDVIFLGSSHAYCSLKPQILADEYGISSFVLANSAQTIPMSYYAAMEAIELQHPKVIVLEALNCTNYAYTVTDSYTHTFFDAMPYCEGKKQGIRDLVDEDNQIYYYLPIGLYHSRWKSLTKADYSSVINDLGGYYPSDLVVPIGDIPLVDVSETDEMQEDMKNYLDKITTLCKEHNVTLMMFATPFNAADASDYEQRTLADKQRILNGLNRYTAENDIPYLNLFYHLNDVGLDVNSDFMDVGHCNSTGADKVTRYVAENLLADYIQQ